MEYNQNADRVAVIEYLAGFDIDANRVMLVDADETGYNYVAQHPDGRPMYHGQFELTFDRKEWPSPEVWSKVEALYNGGGLLDVKDPEVNEDDLPKEREEPPTATKDDEKQQVPAEAVKPTARKKAIK